MVKIKICVADFDKFNEKYPLWSIIYLDINGAFFPDSLWWDATSSVLEMWLDNIVRLMTNETKSCMLNFMDGDYSVSLIKKEDEKIHITLIEPFGERQISDYVDLLYFARQLLSAVEKMKVFYLSYSSSEIIKNLSQKANRLRNAIKEESRFK